MSEPQTSFEILQELAKDHSQIADRVTRVGELPEEERDMQADRLLEALWSVL